MHRFIRTSVAAASLLLVSATVSQAQMAESRIGAKAGVALPMGDFGDAVGLGFHLGGHLALPLQGKLALRFDVDYGRYSGEDGFGIDNVSLLGGVANLVYRMETSSELKPYLLGGIGFYNTTIEGNGGGSADESNLAFNAGIGYDFKFGNSNLFTELRFLSIQTDGSSTTTLPIVIGLRF
ncbi:MAG: porin family protein [Gemmatimonadaceae bacterium]|nr:porin family protein [Gemmatimonadaceae bacterium]